MGKLNVGDSQSYGNPGDTIAVSVDGQSVSAIAATPINASKVLVATTDTGTPYVFTNLSTLISSDRRIARSNPRKKKAIVSSYPFKVLAKGDAISVQGFDDDIDVTISGELIGLVNTGDNYTAIVRDGNSYLFDIGGTQATVSLTGSDFGLTYVPSIYWYGANKLLTSTFGVYPDTTYDETPQITPSGAIQSMTLPNYGRSQIWNILYGTRTTTGTNYLVEDTGLGYVNFSGSQNGNNITLIVTSYGYLTPDRQTLFQLSGVPVSWDDNGTTFSCEDNITFEKSSVTELTKTQTITTHDKQFLITQDDLVGFPIEIVTTASGTYIRNTSFSSDLSTSWSGYQTSGDTMFLCLKSISKSGTGSGTEIGNYENSIIKTGILPLITDANKKQYYDSLVESEYTSVTQGSSLTIVNIESASSNPLFGMGYDGTLYDTSGVSGWTEMYNLSLNLTTTYTKYLIKKCVESMIIIGHNDVAIYTYKSMNNSEAIVTTKNATKNIEGATEGWAINIDGVTVDGTIGVSWYRYGVAPSYNNSHYGIKPFTRENYPPVTGQDYLHSYFDIPDLEEVYTITDNKTTPPISCVVQIGNTSYEIEDTYGNYESGFVFLAENLELQIGSNTLNITTSYIGINSTNGAFKQNIVKEQITTYLVDSSGNSTSNTTYDYHSQPFYIPSGDIEVYSVDNGTVQKWDGVISSFTRSVSGDNQTFQTITFTLISQSTVDFYSWVNIHNGVVIVPKNNHTISILKYIENNKKNVNIYISGETVRVAFSQKITSDNLDGEDEWFADIYEFNTTAKRFERVGNESGSLSEIAGTEYDFVSYYPV